MLSAKEKLVLREIVSHFIESPVPVSSSLIARKRALGMSAATIRSIMAHLEEHGYIYQPHTSAGRIPHTPAYRVYVDSMMKKARLSVDEREMIYESIGKSSGELDAVLKEVSRILAHLSRQLGIIVSPRIQDGIFDKMELVPLSDNKILVVISIRSGFIRTITVEIENTNNAPNLYLVSQILNERLNGMRLSEIRRQFASIVSDIRDEKTGLVKMFTRSADSLFDFREETAVHVMGAHYIVEQQDFAAPGGLSSLVEVLEHPNIFVHLLEQESLQERVSIRIGDEITEQKLRHCSIISARYRVGTIDGFVGIIGPTRMNYSRVASLVEYVARTMTDIHGSN